MELDGDCDCVGEESVVDELIISLLSIGVDSILSWIDFGHNKHPHIDN